MHSPCICHKSWSTAVAEQTDTDIACWDHGGPSCVQTRYTPTAVQYRMYLYLADSISQIMCIRGLHCAAP